MAEFEKFHFSSLNELKDKMKELGISIPVSEDLSPLAEHVKIGEKDAPNSLAVLPMEGCDGEKNGSPSALTVR